MVSRDDPSGNHSSSSSSSSSSSALAHALPVVSESKEAPKVITLANWSLATVPNSPKLTGVSLEERSLWVVLVGKRSDMAEAWHSSIVTERILRNHIKTGSGKSLYILDPPMNIEEMHSNGFSDPFIDAFKAGFPDNWKGLLMSELDRLGRTITKYKTKKAAHPEQLNASTGPTTRVDAPQEAVKRKRGRPKKNPGKQRGGQAPSRKHPPAERKEKRRAPARSVAKDSPAKDQDGVCVEKQEAGVVAGRTVQPATKGQPKKRGPGRPPKLPKAKAPGEEAAVVAPSPPINVPPKRGRGRPKKIRAEQQPPPSAPVPNSPPKSPQAASAPRRRQSGISTVKWGWGGKALIQSEEDEKR